MYFRIGQIMFIISKNVGCFDNMLRLRLNPFYFHLIFYRLSIRIEKDIYNNYV